jgi:hypothetical protein
MAQDASQIARFLKGARLMAKPPLSQVEATVASGVSYAVVTNAEQTGRVMAEALVALVSAYRAEDLLVKQVREWRDGSGQLLEALRVAIESDQKARGVKRSKPTKRTAVVHEPTPTRPTANSRAKAAGEGR